MLKIIITTFCALAIGHIAVAQCVSGDSIFNIKGKWKKRADENMVQSIYLPQIVSRIAKINFLFQKAHPQPMGTTADWNGGMIGTPLIESGPPAYYFSSHFSQWYCNENINKLALNTHSGLWGIVTINSLGGFFQQNITLKEVKINGEDVYILPKPTGQWKGYPAYTEEDKFYGNRTVIITHRNRSSWKQITQNQYLTSLRAVWQKKRDAGAKGYAAQIADLKKSIKEYQDNKDIKPADKKEIIASLEKGIEDYKKQQAEFIQSTTSIYDEKIAVIDNYTAKHQHELNKPAILNLETVHDDFNGKFSELENGGQYLIILDPEYFDKSLPPHVPQLITMYVAWNTSKIGLHYKKQIDENFQIENLAEMIDR